jgi:hypothetical protein
MKVKERQERERKSERGPVGDPRVRGGEVIR